MTNKEALEILYKGIAPNPTANNECIKLCKFALEKQIPKKVKNIYTEDTTYRDETAKFGSCCCGSEVQQGMKFCMKCGQALDWSDTE